MSTPVVEPVRGDNLCLQCQGRRVLDADKARGIRNLAKLDNYYAAMMWDDEGRPWIFCPVCGGSGTATDAMERLMTGVLETKA